MTTDSIVTIVGTLVTIVGTIVTIIGAVIAISQVKEAKNYKEQIQFDIRKIHLSGASERLRRAQDDIRTLPKCHSPTSRGQKVGALLINIKSQFDFALNVIDSQGPDKDIRSILSEAQNKLNSYELGWNSQKIDPNDPHELQSLIQNAISLSSSRIFSLEGKL